MSHRERYPSDFTDSAWSPLRPTSFQPQNATEAGPCPESRWREYVRRSCTSTAPAAPGGDLFHDFAVSWSAAHKHFLRWAKDGTWDHILDALRATVRAQVGRDPQPSAGVIDSCSIKGTAVAGPRGFDAARKVNGIKRHIVVDTLGLLVAVLVTPGNMHDRAAAPMCSPAPVYVAPGCVTSGPTAATPAISSPPPWPF